MAGTMKSRWAWLAVGLLVGGAVSMLLPTSPLQAVGVINTDDFCVCTAAIDEHGEALFTLDPLTGDLSAITINTTAGGFNPPLKANVAKDLKLEPGKRPKFIMIPGAVDMHTQSQSNFAQTVIYVIESNSGLMMMYGVPLSKTGRGQNLVPLLPTPLPVRQATRS